nr:glycosyltransferase family 4 protein [Mycobacterium lepraemurium]
MQQEVARHIPDLLTVSSSADIISDFGVAPEQLHVVPLGVNTELFKPGSGPRQPGRIIAIASADTPLKGVRTLLHAVARLRTVRDLELRLVAKVEPNGPTHKLIAELGISDIVHITSRLSDAALAALFASAEVACIPSLYEGFSLPAVEAMASGTPIVASRVDALTRALGELLDSPEKRRSLGRAGRTRAVDVFSWEAVAAQTVRVYERAIARNAAGRAPC